jgi:hypothetical protein
VTSAIVKAHPAVNITASSVAFVANNTADIEPFWKSVDAFFYYGKYACDVGGTAYSYVNPEDNGTFSFNADFEFPGLDAKTVFEFMQPFYDFVNATGIMVTNPQPELSTRWGPGNKGAGDFPRDSLFGTRIFPRRNWEDDALFTKTMKVVRESVEAGYVFHGIHIAPTEKAAGYPGIDSALNPAFRTTYMHADLFDVSPPTISKEAFARLNFYMEKFRAVTPGGGAYVNEAARLEPNWQESFWGHKYPRLLKIKKARDPWGLFWAPTTPGSEFWEVKTPDGLPTQNGPLCRVQPAVN